jgi:xylose isomerase
MNWKFSANAAFFGLQRGRFTQYQPARTLEEKFAIAGQVKGLQGIELRHPLDFQDVRLVRQLLEHYELELSAINADIKDATHFRHGALSARDAAARRTSVDVLCECMDLAAEFGCKFVTVCPLAEGYDYPFQIDYQVAWDNFIDSVKAVVRHRSDVTLLLEYQPHEPHARILLSNVGKMLHVCAEVDAPNLGANLDIGHSFAALESPAEAATLLARKGRLHYIHTNDNTGDGGDWDMISGTVHFWHWLELLYTLDRLGYNGWFSADIVAKHTEPAAAFTTNILMIQRMTALLRRAGTDKIAELMSRDGNVAATYDYLSSHLK